MPTSVDFARIRSLNGSQHLGFEELCCQLASLEVRPKGSTFIRKGRGSDQGVECFATLPDGGQVAWQAKYFLSAFGDAQVGNLDKSLSRALDAHPSLHTYIVCLALDLGDLRSGKEFSQLQRYERWCLRRIKRAKEAGRQLQIELWDASQLLERLTRDSPLYSGRLLYWFDQERLGTSWFARRFEVSKENLGERYTPASHVDLPIQDALQAVARDESFADQAQAWSETLAKDLKDALLTLAGTSLEHRCVLLRASADNLLASLDRRIDDPAEPFPLSTWIQWAGEAMETVTAALDACETLADKERRDAGRVLYLLYSTLQTLKTTVERNPWALLNGHRLLVIGGAGVGKSHLIAEFGVRQLAAQKPFVLVLTQTLIDGEPWQQILQQLDMADCKVAAFLGALDAAAEARGCRAVLAVDALNERHGLQVWRDRLAGFVKTFEPFPRVCVVLTLRSTYEGHLPVRDVPKVVHHGFAGHAGAAAKAYLDTRGIARTSSPNLLREFENPLFLRTCCDYLDAADLKAIPKGLTGLSDLFNFYLKAISLKVEVRLGLDRHRDIPMAALRAFTQQCVERSRAGSLAKGEAMDLFEQFLPSLGLEGRSLFGALLAEGVLTLDIIDAGGNVPVETVRFTFERLNDHFVAKKLLDEHLDTTKPHASFTREPLSDFISDDAWWRHAGIVEALAIQLPERCDLEILDVVEKDAYDMRGFEEAFENSLLWRDQSRFSQRTMDWLAKLAEVSGVSVYGALVGIATEPRNAFNAMELHRRLVAMRMPERDADWSVFLATEDMSEGGPVESLIDWAWEVRPEEVEADRLLLASVALTWFLSAPNRAIRDMATKGLAHILSRRLATAAELLRVFREVDDPYVVERLLAACYGAVLQGTDPEGLSPLSRQVWIQYLELRRPPTDLVSRDFALGILEYTARFAELPEGIDLAACRPPFDTAWPLEEVSDETLAEYKEGSPNAYDDDIVSSTSVHGDFGHYSVRSAIHGWTVLPLSMAGQTTEQIYKAWCERFHHSATLPQLEAFVTVRKAALAHRKTADRPGDWLDETKRQQLDKSWASLQRKEAKFANLLEQHQRLDYELVGQTFLLESARMGREDVSPRDLNPADVARWVCWRAHDMGWSNELFSAYERSSSVTRERMGNHRVERVGKKFQRIALREAVARIADHLAFDDGDGQIGAYLSTPPELSMLRDIDPSLLVRQTKETGWAYTPRTWWTPATLDLQAAPAAVLLAWLDSPTEGFSTGPENIEVVDPTDRRDWLVLSAFRHWGIPRRSHRIHPDAWSRVTCLLTRKGDGNKLVEQLLAEHRGDSNLLHEDKACAGFLGEHGWREQPPASPRLRTNSWAGITVPCMTTTAELTAESNTKDNSILKGFGLDLPSAWLLRSMNLRLRDGRRPEYVNSNQVVQFLDPSLKERGPGAGVVGRELFLATVEAAGLEPVWLIAGEKNVYGADMARGGFGGRVTYSIAYSLVDGTLVASAPKIVKAAPSPHQLKELLAQENGVG